MNPDVARKRLCPNCLNTAGGMYCGHCGQKQKSAVRHFGHLAGEFFTDVLNLDAKLLRTLKPLLLRPGYLSREYFRGRRMHYVSPLKLYFFLSIVTFFLVQQSVDIAAEAGTLIQIDDDGGKAGEDMQFSIGNFNGEPWHAETNPIRLAWLPDIGNDLINSRLGRLEAAVKKRDWMPLLHTALAATPQALLIILPFFALLLKVFYLFQRRLFMEHMIVALHNHSFLLSVVSLLAVSSTLENWAGLPARWQDLSAQLAGAVMLWVPVYFLWSLKHIYGQSWKMTLFKFFAIAFCYLFLFVSGLVVNVILAILFL
jgi:hypothetical protein